MRFFFTERNKMTELEKLRERLMAVEQALSITQHAATVERKMSSDRHHSGHFTKALTELDSVRNNIKNLIKRHEIVEN